MWKIAELIVQSSSLSILYRIVEVNNLSVWDLMDDGDTERSECTKLYLVVSINLDQSVWDELDFCLVTVNCQ